MLYVCTVHFQTTRWIKRQLFFIDKNIKTEHRILSCVPSGYTNKDFYINSHYDPESKISYNHADKLNYLAKIVSLEARPDDIIVFLDGDAFPIRPIDEFISKKLEDYKLIAIQRKENDGDIQPHPSFAATTVGFWNEIDGDWNPGFTWKDIHNNEVSDTGANLLEKLLKNNIDWYPMTRTNRVNLHPLWFGIYDDIIYHHGAGYRPAISRLDLNLSEQTYDDFMASRQLRRNEKIKRRVFNKIRFNSRFYEYFL